MPGSKMWRCKSKTIGQRCRPILSRSRCRKTSYTGVFLYRVQVKLEDCMWCSPPLFSSSQTLNENKIGVSNKHSFLQRERQIVCLCPIYSAWSILDLIIYSSFETKISGISSTLDVIQLASMGLHQ